MPTTETKALKEVGRRIRAARVRADLTQEAVAASSGIDYKRYQRLEQGAVNPTIRTLLRVSAAIGVDLWELLGGPQERSR
ncbi:MAG: helix-turn-helix transcriptional regulator [Anaeromyxobacter sp.]